MSRLVLLDSTVLIDAVGDSPPERHSSQHIFSAIAESQIDAIISIESIQETFTVLARRRGDRAFALRVTRRFADTFRIADADGDVLSSALELLQDHDQILGADAIVLATAVNAGATALITRDKGLGTAAGDIWVDPSDLDALRKLLSTS